MPLFNSDGSGWSSDVPASTQFAGRRGRGSGSYGSVVDCRAPPSDAVSVNDGADFSEPLRAAFEYLPEPALPQAPALIVGVLSDGRLAASGLPIRVAAQGLSPRNTTKRPL